MNLTAALFTSTFTIVVAAGLVQLDAGPEADGPARKPAMHEAVVGGRHLQVSLDRERVPAGEAVHLTITATDPDAGTGGRLRIALLEQSGSRMSRVMMPPTEVWHHEVRLGREPLSVPVTLGGPADGVIAGSGAAGDPLTIAGRATQYTVVVTAAPPDGKGHGGALASAEADTVAGLYVPVFAYQPEAFRLTIDPPAAGKPGDPVDVTVRVKSLAGKPLTGISLGLSSEVFAIDDQPRIASLAPGAEQVVHLHGHRTAVAAGPVTLQAFASADYGGTAGAWATIDATDGSLVARASEPSVPGGLDF